jgi:hypothetical protein
VTNIEPPSSEDQVRTFGEWKVWFEWGSVRSDDPGGRSFLQRGSSAAIANPATPYWPMEGRFRRRLGELMDMPTVEDVCHDFEPRITATSLGKVLAPRLRVRFADTSPST